MASITVTAHHLNGSNEFQLALPGKHGLRLHVISDVPFFFAKRWVDQKVAEIRSGSLTQEQFLTHLRIKVGKHPLLKQIRDWLRANGAAWDDATLVVSEFNTLDAAKRPRNYINGCGRVSIRFHDDNLAMRFKLAWVGV